MKELDFSRVYWGHNLEKVGDSYFCICTPGPEVGDIAIAPNGSRWRFTSVKWDRNPKDLYVCDLERIK